MTTLAKLAQYHNTNGIFLAAMIQLRSLLFLSYLHHANTQTTRVIYRGLCHAVTCKIKHFCIFCHVITAANGTETYVLTRAKISLATQHLSRITTIDRIS